MISRRAQTTGIAKRTFFGVTTMTIHKTLIAAWLLLAAPAFAEFVIVIDAVETQADSLVLPSSVNGNMGFMALCGRDDCTDARKRARLTDETTFFVDDKAVKFEDFRKRYAKMKLDKDSYALVSYDLKKNTVTRVMVNQ